MYRRRLSFTAESDGDINSCSDIQTLNAGDEMLYGLNQSQESSLISGDIVTVDGPSPRNDEVQQGEEPSGAEEPRSGFNSDEPPIWPDISQDADEFPPLAAAQASQPDQFPPLMRSTTQATAHEEFDEEYGNENPPYKYPTRASRHFSRSPPRTIMIGRARSRSLRRSLSKRPGPRSSKLHDDDTAPTSMWNTRLCGMRADRLIVLLAMILFLAVGVIVAALIYANRMAPNASQSSVNTADELSLTRTPVASPILIPTVDPPSVAVPSQPSSPSAPIASGSREDTVMPTNILPTLSPTIFSTIPPTTMPTPAPQTFPTTVAPTIWPKRRCGGDNDTAEFPVNNQGLNANCTWVAASETRADVCSAGSPAHFFCRETCENCEPDTPWPSQFCGVDSETALIFAGPGVGTHSCAWVREMYGGHGKRLCNRRGLAFHACRETCQNCGPFGLGPTNTPTRAPIVAGDAEIVSPTTSPIATAVTDIPTLQPITKSPTSQSITQPPSLAPITDLPSMTPTTSPPTIRPIAVDNSVPDMRSIIIDAFPASEVRLSRAASPQSVAVRWMERAFDRGAYLDVSDDRLLQIFALATFAYSTNVDQWNSRLNWLNWSVDECQWFGITCGGQSVIAIDLPSNQLSGPVPAEISLFQDSLRILVLSSNSIIGIIPTAIGNLVNLEELRIDRNDFAGMLPTSIGRLQRLRLFYLEHNPAIRGEFPQSVVSMDSLEELVFYYTSISSITSDVCTLDLHTLIYDCKQIQFPTCWTKCFYLCGGNTGIIC